MSLVLFAASGLVDDYLLLSGAMLIHVTMHYGHFAEELCRPMYDPKTGKPSVWVKSSRNPDTLFFNWLPCLAPFERFFPSFLGWIPYATIWFVFLHNFLTNANDNETGRGAPTFVYIILIGQFSVFTCFAAVQTINLFFYNGPSWFAYGEMTYVILSFVAKGLLAKKNLLYTFVHIGIVFCVHCPGITLIFSVFAFDSFEEAAAA